MRKCYMYQTPIGPFYIIKHQSYYHVVYDGVSFGICPRAGELAAVLGYGYKFKNPSADFDEIDTSNLGIPCELSDWTRCYFAPSSIRVNFKHNSGLKTQDTAKSIIST